MVKAKFGSPPVPPSKPITKIGCFIVFNISEINSIKLYHEHRGRDEFFVFVPQSRTSEAGFSFS
ncbi:hypothetical protein B9J78_03380 [bacterium Unc6]|nr:hypothetical protein [bacterium Unc6]